MHKLSSIIIFYKPYILWSFIINIIITILHPEFTTAICTKLLLAVFLWYYFKNIKGMRLLNFYNSLGVSTFKLFVSIFIIDVFITIGYLLIIKEFI